ncbi:DNA repair protein RAD51 homolog 3 [Condylostylus longicornis]|uniref:DNA repair protein RAD51 homolog 3 n=1 Tax=Condylostylus longicornis TaxID=2530218 RepID=UPI00244E1994|nr:DNA repair protein RAD51 homolog 3 [Condylostylus longicornis]XP_055378116.1 DNA repair protein RAD51 homolog 3 [Condylostylus longicornis]XP_055378117.1 DNA repair protein RAD51 homolog 3 [Condylostylus longicornis]XP_055378118.1 DNA repair protein RAD51 homolog 3 [Condylostylus longicornis]
MFQKSSLKLFGEENVTGFNIKTFIKALDHILGGGISSGILTEFCGAPGTGKTHMCLQMCLHAQLTNKKGRVGKAIFIDTSQGFNPHIIREMAAYTSEKLMSGIDGVTITVEEFLSNIEYLFCNTIEAIKQAINVIKEKVEKGENIKLIVVDSFTYIFRNFNGPSYLRLRLVYELLTELQILADKNELAVILTNQFSSKVTDCNNLILYPALGEAYAHKIGQRLIFEKGIIQRRIFLHKTLYGSSAIIPFLINQSGVRSINTYN